MSPDQQIMWRAMGLGPVFKQKAPHADEVAIDIQALSSAPVVPTPVVNTARVCRVLVVCDAKSNEINEQSNGFNNPCDHLLKHMLLSIGLGKDAASSTVRVFEESELATALGATLQTLNPEFVLMMGEGAAAVLLNNQNDHSNTNITIHCVETYQWAGRVVSTYHPNELMLAPQLKAQAWKALLLLKQALD